MPCDTAGLGYSPFARRYWGNRCYFLFLQVLRCFSSLRSPPALLDVGIAPHGLPHSDICGSMRICRSPQLFAACHVLLRLREPRHPPCALSRSVISSDSFIEVSYFSEPKFDLFAFRFARETFLLCFYSCLLTEHPFSCMSMLPVLSLSFSEWWDKRRSGFLSLCFCPQDK